MNNNKFFCTLFDKNYLIKGVAMIDSLIENCPAAYIYVLCMDDYVHKYLSKFASENVILISLENFETEQLLNLKKTRSIAEYCWTLSPCLPSYVLSEHPLIDQITYLDADLYFYSSVSPIFEEIGDSSIAIIEHRFISELIDRLVNGRFCVEWVTFRRDYEGMKCLARWREQCIDWCFYRLEDGKMGDQKYLDEWPGLYENCHIIENIGAGIAPWNYGDYEISNGDRGILICNEPLIFYHFHQFQISSKGKFERLSRFYSERWSVPDVIYIAYERRLNQIIERVEVYDPDFFGKKNKLKEAIRAIKKWQL